MHPAAEHALADIDALTDPHLYAHRCMDGEWYRNGRPCPTRQQLDHVATQVRAVAAAPALAAASPEMQTRVMEAMTGFTAADLNDEDREGWTDTARMAMEAHAAILDQP